MVGGNLCEESNDQDGNWRDYRMADVRLVSVEKLQEQLQKMDLPMGYLK